MNLPKLTKRKPKANIIIKKPISVFIAVSDLHCGCQLGLCPETFTLDEGGVYRRNKIQDALWEYWDEFWGEWVPEFANGLPYGVVVNGDSLDGVHHKAVHQITHNLADQQKIAEVVLRPIVDLCEGRMFMIRGTEAHTGPSGQHEEQLAKAIGALPTEDGQYSRYELWLNVGEKGLVHCAHHIGTTGSQAYESTAVHKELTESFTEAARWREIPPDIVMRSHRHRYFKTEIATATGMGRSIVTPGWQAKTPFAFKIPGARQSLPQFGGVATIESPHGELYTRAQVWSVKRGKPEKLFVEDIEECLSHKKC
jgi:hypothetical protein